LIGMFVYFGASAEETATTIHIRLRGRRVADVMLRDPVVLDPAMGVDELQTLMERTAQRVFPVVGPDGYVGLLRPGRIPLDAPRVHVADLVDRTTPTIAPACRLEEDAVPLLVSSPARALAVAEDGRIVGLVCVEDVEHLVTDRV
jgi:predicted transcriptional regulator